MIKKYFLQILIVLLLFGIAWVLFLVKTPQNQNKNNQESINPIQASIAQTAGDKNAKEDFFPVRNWMIDEPEILAKSAIILSINPVQQKDNLLYQKNINQVLPIASLTKIMTAIIALENFDLEKIIKVSKESVLTDGDTGGLIIDEELKVKDLLYIMLIESSNDAAMALANDNQTIPYDEFVNLMNVKAKELNLENTHFKDASGLSQENQSTALEMANLVKYTLKFSLLSEILETKAITINSIGDKFIHNLTSTNKLLGKIPVILGGKTGFTEEARGCMVTFSNISNNYLISVVLGSENREEDTGKLIDWAQKAWLWQ